MVLGNGHSLVLLSLVAPECYTECGTACYNTCHIFVAISNLINVFEKPLEPWHINKCISDILKIDSRQ